MAKSSYVVERDHSHEGPAWRVVRRNSLGQGWEVAAYTNETRAHVVAAALTDAQQWEAT
jgi:hypothetical protein